MLQSYDETLTYPYERLLMFSRIGVAAYKKDLIGDGLPTSICLLLIYAK